MQYRLLCMGQPVWKALLQTFDLRGQFHNPTAADILPPFFQPPYPQKKQKKLVKYQPLPGKQQILLVCRNMNMLHSKIVFCQLMLFAQISRHVIPFHLPHIQGLSHRPDNGFIPQAFGLPVHWLHMLHDSPIALFGIDLRLFHRQAVILFYHLSAKNMIGSSLKGISQKRHIVPH